MDKCYVQFGSGPFGPKGWLNFDSSPTLRLQRLPIVGNVFKIHRTAFSKNVKYGNIVKHLLAPAGSAEAVYASHVLEHLSREDFLKALRNTHAMLRSGGVFRLIVPDLEWRCREYVKAKDAGDIHGNDVFMESAHLGMKKRSLIISLGGSLHLWMWDESSMRAALEQAGFIKIRRCEFGDAEDPMFEAVESQGRFVDWTGFHELAMEARKP